MSYLSNRPRLVLIGFFAGLLLSLLATSSSTADANHPNPNGIHWDDPFVTWCISGTVPSGWATQINLAAATWSNPSDWFLAPVGSCSNAEMRFYADDFPPFVVGYTQPVIWSGLIYEAHVYLNTYHSWTTYRPEGDYMGWFSYICQPSCDVRSIYLHEIGHTVVFGHPSPNVCPWGDPKSFMCQDWIIRRTMTSHDISSIQAIY